MAHRRGLDERHLRQRSPPRAGAQARAGRRRPDRRHRPEVRPVKLGRSAALTDTGRKRRHNEDVYVLDPPIFAIADGMGGANAGQVAARLAAEALRPPGTARDAAVHPTPAETRPGDVFLLCSDALYSMAGNERIPELVERNRRDLNATAKALIQAANKGGGDDNITVVAFEIADAVE